jgi:hypothetical protein
MHNMFGMIYESKHCPDSLQDHNELKNWEAFFTQLFPFVLIICPQENPREPGRPGSEWPKSGACACQWYSFVGP